MPTRPTLLAFSGGFIVAAQIERRQGTNAPDRWKQTAALEAHLHRDTGYHPVRQEQ